jgi:hypothetical protein
LRQKGRFRGKTALDYGERGETVEVIKINYATSGCGVKGEALVKGKVVLTGGISVQ